MYGGRRRTPYRLDCDRITIANVSTKRDEHKRRIYGAIRENPGISRNRIARILRIRPSTVSDLVSQLISDTIVSERPLDAAQGLGRPEIPLHPVHSRFVIVGIHIVSKQLRAILMNSSETPLAEASLLLPDDIDNDGFVENVVEVVRYLVGKRPDYAEVIGVTLIVPGLVRFEPRVWVLTTRFPNIRNVSIDRLERALQLQVVFKRALDAGLQYLLLKNERYNDGGTVLLHWGYGIGAAYAYNGVIMESKKGSVLEIGHFRYNTAAAKRCVCGLTGCLETEAALWSLFPTLCETEGPISEDEDSREVARAIRHFVRSEAFGEVVTAISRAVANLYAVLSPERFLFVGPFTEQVDIIHTIRDTVLSMTMPSRADFFDIEPVAVEHGGETVAASETVFRSRLDRFLNDKRGA